MSDNIEHRAFWENPVCPEIKLSVPGGIGKLTFLDQRVDYPHEANFTIKPSKKPRPLVKHIENSGFKFYEHLTEEIIQAQESGKMIIYSGGMMAGRSFVKNNLRVLLNKDTMPCPTCAMRCEKTHDGYIPQLKTKYEFFHCYNCKKNFKITL